MKIRIGTRDSALAMVQAQMVKDALEQNGCEVELVPMKTKGDKILDKTLSKIGGKGLFVAELEDALKMGEVDLLVHSMKDLPMELAEGYPLVAASRRADVRDVLVLPTGAERLDETKPIGTSSNRRAAAWKLRYPQMKVKPVRGNLQTRLRKLDDENEGYAGLILAAAGMERMGLQKRISRYLPTDWMLPAAGQGILAVQAAENFDVSLLNGFADADALAAAKAERAFVRLMAGDCASPIGAYCEIKDETASLSGFNGFYQLSVDGENIEALPRLLAEKFASRGRAILVGAGPGNPDLLTVAGKNALEHCDVVLYDNLASDKLLKLAPENALRVFVGKKAGESGMKQEEINRLLCSYTARGLQVVRLKGGDPFVFGRGGEELAALKEMGLKASVIPGITSAIAAPESAFIPVTHRGLARSFTVITAHEKDGVITEEQAASYAGIGGTLVFLMGVAAVQNIQNGLLLGGMDADTPAAIIENATLPQQRNIMTSLGKLCDSIAQYQISAPAVIVIGDTVGLQEELKPKQEKYCVVTRAEEKDGNFEKLLHRKGVSVYPYPCIRTEILPMPKNFVQQLRMSDVLVFTSEIGVKGFMEWLFGSNMDIRALHDKQIAVVGEKTGAALKEYGLHADIVPVKAGGKWLVEEIAMLTARDKKILLLQAEQPAYMLKDKLSEEGFTDIRQIAVYRTQSVLADAKSLLKAVQNGIIGVLSFTSGSCVRGFAESFDGDIPEEIRSLDAVCIGETAMKMCEKYGLHGVQTSEPTLESMAALCEQILTD